MVAITKYAYPSSGPWGEPGATAEPPEVDEALSIRAEETGATRLLRPLRRDALPEHTRYVDTGCEVHSSCLTCPLVRCRFDEPGGSRALLGRERDRTILALRREGRPISLIAQRFGVSRRTIFRVLAAAREADGGGIRL